MWNISQSPINRLFIKSYAKPFAAPSNGNDTLPGSVASLGHASPCYRLGHGRVTSSLRLTARFFELSKAGTHHNNKMERMNGEIRDREKVFRGLKKSDTPILTGYQIYHNYIRQHEALDGKTPAEVAGIQVKGENKWQTIIQNSSMLLKNTVKR